MHLASNPPLPALPRHPPRSATPPGECGRARLARERAARPPRALRGRTRASPAQGHVRMALAAAAARPLAAVAAASTTAPAPWLRGRRAAFPRGTDRSPGPSPTELRPRAPLSPPSRVSLRPVLLAAAAGCWLLAAGAHHVRPGGPVAQPHHNRRLSSAHGARLGPRTLPLGQSVGARPPPSPPPHLLPPHPSPHPRFGLAVTQPLSGSHPM